MAEEDHGLAFLPDGRRMAVVCVGILSCALSLYGSTTLVWLIIFRVNKDSSSNNSNRSQSLRSSSRSTQVLYHRLILGLSLFDIFNTTGFLLSPFFLPRDTQLKWAVGNRATCTVSGFFNQFVIGSYVYNAFLSLYYLGLIRYNLPASKMKNYMEPTVHILALVLPLIQSVPSAFLGSLNAGPLLGLCAQYPHPYECYAGYVGQGLSSDVPCTRGVNSTVTTVGNVLVGLTVILATTALVATWLVWWTVRQQIRRNRRYAVDWQQPESTRQATTTTSSQRQRQQQPLTDVQQKRLKAVATQSICYTGAVVNLLFWFGVGSALEGHYHRQGTLDGSSETDLVDLLRNDTCYFVFMLFLWMFFPLQGLYNWIIYLRPRLVRWRDAYPELSWYGAYQEVLSGKPVPSSSRTAHLTKMHSLHLVQVNEDSRGASGNGGADATEFPSDRTSPQTSGGFPASPTGLTSLRLTSSLVLFGVSRSVPTPETAE